jgi:enoyl-CoA hydratase
VRLAKRAVLAAFETSLEAGLEVERIAFLAALASEDAKEGTLAVLEKRPPQFEGR